MSAFDFSITRPYEDSVLDVFAKDQIKQVLGSGQIQRATLPSASTGTTTGASSTTVLIDTSATFSTDGVVAGDIVYNVTDTSYAIVKTVDSETQLTCTALTGGTDDTFQTSDSYAVKTAPNMVVLLTAVDGTNEIGYYKRDSGNTAWVAMVNQDANNIKAGSLTGSTYSSVFDMQRLIGATGQYTGGTITDAGGGNIDVAAGTGYIRTTDSHVGDPKFFDWSASLANAIPLDTIRYVGVEYNAGTPQVIIKTTNTWTFHNEFPLGCVVNEGGTLHIQNDPHAVGNGLSHVLQWLDQVEGIVRDNLTGGIIVSETGTRNIAVSAGKLWRKLNEFTITAIDTSVSGGFDTYLGITLDTAAATQWDNLNYNNAGVKTLLANNKWATLWWYMETDGNLVMVYGTVQHNSQAAAEAELAPSSIPNRLSSQGILIAQTVFQKSAATFASINSAFDLSFSGSAGSDHGNLTGLGDDDHSQYSLLSSQAGAPSTTPTRVGEINVDTTNDEAYISMDTVASTDWRRIPRIRYIALRVLEKATATSVATNLGGDFVIPFSGTILQSGTDLEQLSAVVDTAGTTGTMTIDINLNGTTIMTTNKISIETTETSSATALTQPALTTASITAGDKITIDVDVIQTTPALGLTIYLAIREN